MKKISIDTNFHYHGPTRPTISPFVISRFNLLLGEEVIGFQDSQEWEGIIGFDKTYPEEMEWYLDISDGEEFPVTSDREAGRDEGWTAAIPIGELSGEIAVATAMLTDGIDIDTIKKFTRLSRTRLENIKMIIVESNQ